MAQSTKRLVLLGAALLQLTAMVAAESSCALVLKNTTNQPGYLRCTGDKVQATVSGYLLSSGFQATGLSSAVAQGSSSSCSVSPNSGCMITFCGTGSVNLTAQVQGMQPVAQKPPAGSIICIKDAAEVTIQNSSFVSNCAQGVLQATGSSRLTVQDTGFTDGCVELLSESHMWDWCQSLQYSIVLIRATGDAVLSLTRVKIMNNIGCNGIRAADNVRIDVEDSTFAANLILQGTGVRLVGQACANITRCKFRTLTGQSSLHSALVDLFDHSGSVVIADSVMAGDTAVSGFASSRVRVTNINMTDVTGPYFTSRYTEVGKPGIRIGGPLIVELTDVHMNRHDPCDVNKVRDMCPMLSSGTVILCKIKPAASAVSVHGLNSGYADVCVDSNRVQNLAVVYALFGMALISILVGACIWKSCSNAGPQSETFVRLQLLLDKPLVQQGLMVMCIVLVGADIVSDIVTVSALSASGAAVYYYIALLLPIFCCSITLHASICKAYFPPKQKVQGVPGTLWPYKLFCRCHAAVPGVLGFLVVGVPWVWLGLMHYPFMLLHALFPKHCFHWLHLEHYAKLFSLYGATLQAPISIILITLGSWMGVSDDIFPKQITTWVFFLTVTTSMGHILLWVGTLSYAAVTGAMKSTLQAIFIDLIKVPDGMLPDARKDLALVPVQQRERYQG